MRSSAGRGKDHILIKTRQWPFWTAIVAGGHQVKAYSATAAHFPVSHKTLKPVLKVRNNSPVAQQQNTVDSTYLVDASSGLKNATQNTAVLRPRMACHDMDDDAQHPVTFNNAALTTRPLFIFQLSMRDGSGAISDFRVPLHCRLHFLRPSSGVRPSGQRRSFGTVRVLSWNFGCMLLIFASMILVSQAHRLLPVAVIIHD